jgi:exodeoxyribonuclease VII small subunit
MPRAKKGSKEPGFEEALERLERIVGDLEGGDLPLEESLRLFEEGVRLTRQCAARLDEAQRRIDLLTKGTEGGMRLVPFDTPEDDQDAAPPSTPEDGPDEP